MRIHGWDMALNHAAFIQLDDGKLTGFWYITDIAGSAQRSKSHGFRMPLLNTKDRHLRGIDRLATMEEFIKDVILVNEPDCIGIEDYAIRAEQGAHYLGEMGGLARLLAYHSGAHLRLHDPISLKMFVTHDGTADKGLMRESVLERWGVNFGIYDVPPKPGKKGNHQTSEDLCDAFGLAQLVWVEVQLRSGALTMDKLEHDKERQVFMRVTKTYPVSLLGRDWIRKG